MQKNSVTQPVGSQQLSLNKSNIISSQKSMCLSQTSQQKDQEQKSLPVPQQQVEQPQRQMLQSEREQRQEAVSTSFNQEYKPNKNAVYKHNMLNLLSVIKKGTGSMELDHDLERQFEEIDNAELKALWQAIYQSLLISKKSGNDLQLEQKQFSLNEAHDYGRSESEKTSNQDFVNENISFLDNIEKQKKPEKEIQSKILPPPSSKGTVKTQDQGYDFSLMQESSFENTRLSNKIVSHQQDQAKKSNPIIFNYLLQLTNAQTQLTYLCQHFNWNLTFKSDVYQEPRKLEINYKPNKKTITSKALNKTHKYTCKAEVITIKKNSKEVIGYCEIANSKKEARHIASLICLYQVYHSLEGVWEEYEEQKKKNPSLKQDLNTNNYNVILYAGLPIPDCNQAQENKDNTAGFDFNKKYKRKYIPKYTAKTQTFCFENPEEINLEHYISNLKNYKEELNYFIENNQLTFLKPHWESVMSNGYWEVKGSIKQKDPGSKQIIYAANHRNMMVAQENVCREMLLDLYSQYDTLFRNFLEIKNTKGPY